VGELSLRQLLAALDEDRGLIEMLLEEGLLEPPLERDYTAAELEAARVARVLHRELDVNLAGVEVILHLREQILALRKQMEEILRHLQSERARR
jgi:MerR family transcriptional regulator/heat shock protein HspR